MIGTLVKRALLLTCLFAIAGSSSAFAKAIAPEAGRAVSWSDQSCFTPWYAAMTNNCSGTKTFEVPVVVDNAGNQTVNVSAYGASSANNVGCVAVGLDYHVTSYWSSPTTYLPSFGSSQQITLTGAYVPSMGRLYVTCYMNTGGRVNTIQYNPG